MKAHNLLLLVLLWVVIMGCHMLKECRAILLSETFFNLCWRLNHNNATALISFYKPWKNIWPFKYLFVSSSRMVRESDGHLPNKIKKCLLYFQFSDKIPVHLSCLKVYWLAAEYRKHICHCLDVLTVYHTCSAEGGKAVFISNMRKEKKARAVNADTRKTKVENIQILVGLWPGRQRENFVPTLRLLCFYWTISHIWFSTHSTDSHKCLFGWFLGGCSVVNNATQCITDIWEYLHFCQTSFFFRLRYPISFAQVKKM